MLENSAQNQANVSSILTAILERTSLESNKQQKQNEKAGGRHFTFFLNLPDEQILKTTIEVSEKQEFLSAIMEALTFFQGILSEKGQHLDITIDNFTPRLAKKSGKPKTDMPCIDLKTKFGEVQVNSCSIQIKNQKALTEGVKKSVSESSLIASQYQMQKGKQLEVYDELEQMKTEKNKNCFFSFC